MKNNKGIVLIEMIIYIGLFSIMIGGLIISAFNLMDTTVDTDYRTASQEEMNFVVKKMEWVLTGATDVTVPSSGVLNITNPNLPGNDFSFVFDSINKRIDLNDEKITSLNVNVNSLSFSYIPQVGNIPEGVNINIDIDGQTTSFSKYLKYVP